MNHTAVISDFAITLESKQREINRLANVQKIPGMTYDDVRAELQEVLWKAWSTYDPKVGTTLGQYWWQLWIRRKGDLIAAFFAQHRPERVTDAVDVAVLAEVADAMSPFLSLSDLCPSKEPIDRAVWVLLCHGFRGTEIRKMLHLSWRKFYKIIESWKTDEVRSLLAG